MTTTEPLTADPTAWLRAEVAELRRAILVLREELDSRDVEQMELDATSSTSVL